MSGRAPRPAVGERPALFVSAQMDDVEVWSVAGGEAAVYSAGAPGGRTNQDAAAIVRIDDETALLAVADGVGGERGGARAAELAVATLAEAVRGHHPGESLRVAVLDGIEAANRAVQAAPGGGLTTLAALSVERGVVRPYHVGDSAIHVFGQKGKMKLQTVSHSPVGFGLEAGLLDEAEAMHHRDRHVVSNVLGVDDMRIEVGAKRTLALRDTAVIASDGLFDNLHSDEIVDMARAGRLDDAARALAREAGERMRTPSSERPSKPDDLTLIVFRRSAP